MTDAADGAAGLEAVRGLSSDLVVTDMMMPVMGGVEFIRCLRGDPATAHIPILAATGDPQLPGAANAVVPKPYLWDQLIAVASTLLKEGRVLS